MNRVVRGREKISSMTSRALRSTARHTVSTHPAQVRHARRPGRLGRAADLGELRVERLPLVSRHRDDAMCTTAEMYEIAGHLPKITTSIGVGCGSIHGEP